MKKLLLLLSITLFATGLFAQAPGDPPLIGQAAQTATINNIIPLIASANATYVAGFNSFSIQIVSTGTAGTFIFEESLDNVTFQPATVFNSALQIPVSINTAIAATSSSIIYKGAISGYWLRCRIATTITGGSIQSVTKLMTTPVPFTQEVVAQGTAGNLLGTMSQGGTWTIQPGNTPNTAPWLAAGKDANSAATSVNPLLSGGRVVQTTIATADVTFVAGDAVHSPITTGQQQITKDFGTSELDYTFHNTSVGTTVTLQTIVPASGTASIRNYITGISLQSDALGAAGNVWVLDGQGAIGTSVTIATPGVFTSSAHDLKIGDAIVFTSLGTITGITTNTVYYITATSFAATTFTVATTQGGTALAITGGTAAFTFYRLLYPLRFQTTAIGTPAMVIFPTPLKGFANSAINLLIPTSLTSGNIYLTVNGYRGF